MRDTSGRLLLHELLVDDGGGEDGHHKAGEHVPERRVLVPPHTQVVNITSGLLKHTNTTATLQYKPLRGGAHKTCWVLRLISNSGIFLSHYLSKAYTIWHICDLKACPNSRLVRFWLCQNLTNLALDHKHDLRLKKCYKYRPRQVNVYIQVKSNP